MFLINMVSNCQRKIINGKEIGVDKPYVGYLVKAQVSPQKYDAWICGGAIVSPMYIITSAACIEDVQHLYAVVGYKKYVHSANLNDDKCTKNTKKKIVLTCVPKAYELDYTKVSVWSYIDIAVVKTESAIQFNDEKYTKFCSYSPAAIPVNYESRYQDPGTDAVVYGWGHKEIYRKPHDAEDYNQKTLQYAPQLLQEKSVCKKVYKGYNMDLVIDKYMLCTMEGGNVDEKGDLIGKSKPVLVDGCVTKRQRLMGAGGISCEENEEMPEYIQDPIIFDATRRNGSQTNETYTSTRRHGICQNDHGGPLVRWIGNREVLIGVASVFRVNNKSQCVGPFLFTSTQCNGKFLDCVLNEDGESLRRNLYCDEPPSVRGFDMIRRTISWMDHPEGPAENEIQMRPQIPLRNYGYTANQDGNVRRVVPYK
ncbi:hypothetical protein O3G_MSEX006290 [Manduca sexta]|uniref:Peptidase S1 domain-containing protein n=1 Tax=Manduca sexta TaxID=7130 RepID=A0A922CLK9_MANSE|nr:hypothetical protein O3G_MSEX006290 [Manduca sexta]